MLQSFDPATGEVVWEGPAAKPAAVTRAVDVARCSLAGWAATPLAQRLAMVRGYRGVLEARSEDLARLIARETGKPLWEGRGEVASMIGKIDLSIAAQAERAGEKRSATMFGETVLRHNPHGVMAVLGPYNFPGHLPNGHIVPALLAGNVVVFKPSELTPAVGETMADAWQAAGLPEGVFTLVQGAKETGAALVESDIDGLLFTGSAAAGAHFRRIFADRPKVILALELGGNNPLVVWDGADAALDVEEAAALVVQSAYVTSGQRCSCARRLILPHGTFGDAVVEAIAALRDRLRVHAWNADPAPYMGPLVSAEAATRAQQQVGQIVALGARPIRLLEPLPDRRATFVTPALLDVTGLAVPDEEIFAPVLQVTRVDSFDEAIAAANATRFGLAAGLVSPDLALWQRFVRESRAGVVNRNRPTAGASGAMPFGGLGDSGNHRPSAFYAADYCAYPVASFEAAQPTGNVASLAGMLIP
ncbi:succinylglutamate-semialdehyde dehydrogenase [Novosphingobium sp. JCM 18896]|uniref:succinylglutamate-semialdehyde dehydrogenase n=1 Tax=Novosphingobium sp. JCM 18896 TaxID=2989731 RepID=UPI0022231D9D|nr:succinylglutamate-semialdehyde dehydrogenase [Novosphingobium sp. JCM 18896]MCW1427573.1 succinylglutamate-semialdehyde dehydrogenase [Novosphingobium sp. JCM 18896]